MTKHSKTKPTRAQTSADSSSDSPAGAAASNHDDPPPPESAEFPIVGIGASAGGLEALERFLSHVPDNSGMAFIVIQHLDPTRKGVMPELLQRTTPMAVVQADDQMEVEPDTVYVIPPNKDMSILHGKLHLLEQVPTHGLRLPIDFFFRALSADRGERAICVILSGMGSDGTLGLKSIKEKGGLVLAQEPTTAGFDGMPRSAIDTELVDIVAPPEVLPLRLVSAYGRPAFIPTGRTEEIATESGLNKVLILLRGATGHDFSQYKKSTLYRRIERRMAIHQIARISGYVRLLQENPGEAELLFKELLIGVTSFFRDAPAWDCLRDGVLSDVLANCSDGRTLRAWVPACSTGEEAYSLAMVFREALDKVKARGRYELQVFATDLDRDAIDKARQGYYPTNITADVSPERLERFFVREQGGYRVAKEIREKVVFAVQNVQSDPPFTKLDILSCRNLLIYVTAELQRVLLPLFHYSLNPGGVLFLGSAETIGGFTELFSALDSKSRLYRRSGTPAVAGTLEFPTRLPASAAGAEQATGALDVRNIQLLTEQLILRQFAPAAVLVNGQGDIVYISGRTGRYLEPAAGKANWNIHVMAREGLRHGLAVALQRAQRQRGVVNIDDLMVDVEGAQKYVSLGVHAIDEPSELRGMMLVVFRDVAAPPAPLKDTGGAPRGSRLAEFEGELMRLREENRTLREEMQTSHEELRSSNEELQSTNEELQSTNEELTTSKEELQSLNEELQTVNAELQSKVDDLSRVNNDMTNLLNSTDIATVFLDGLLKVRRFTTPTTRLFKLIPSDIGRPLSDIVTDLDYPNMQGDAREVLRTLVLCEREVKSSGGNWYSVRIMPYRTLENVIDGVVITFFDLSALKSHHALLPPEKA